MQRIGDGSIQVRLIFKKWKERLETLNFNTYMYLSICVQGLNKTPEAG